MMAGVNLTPHPTLYSFLSHQVVASQAVDHQILTSSSSIKIPHVVSRSLKVTRCIITLGNEDLVLVTALERFVERDRGAHKFLLDFAQSLESGLELKVVVGATFGDGGDDGYVIVLGADVVCGRNDGDVDI